MIDIVPSLLKPIRADFLKWFNASTKVKTVYEAIRAGTATYHEAHQFAVDVGNCLAKSFKANLSSSVLPDGRMYYNIGKAILDDTFHNNFDLVTDVTSSVQSLLNKSAGIGLKPQLPEWDEDLLMGFVNRLASEANFDDISWILDDPVVNYTQGIVDRAIKANAEYQHKSGIDATITRTGGWRCCDWCAAQTGSFLYPAVPQDVYRRHENCRCEVLYYPGNGNKSQNVHSKAWR